MGHFVSGQAVCRRIGVSRQKARINFVMSVRLSANLKRGSQWTDLPKI